MHEINEMGASWLIKITKNNEKYALAVVRIFVCFVYFVVYNKSCYE